MRPFALLALAGCDVVFPSVAIAIDAPRGDLAVALAVADVVTSEGPGRSATSVHLTFDNPAGRAVYYKLHADQGMFARSNSNVVEGQAVDLATESWVPPYAVARAKIEASVSFDPFLADPATTTAGVEVRQRVGHAAFTSAGPIGLQVNNILATVFTPMSAALLVEMGAYVATPNASIELAVFQTNAASSAKQRVAATPSPGVVVADAMTPVVVPVTPPVAIAANLTGWIAVQGSTLIQLSSTGNQELVGFSQNGDFTGGFSNVLTTTDGQAVGIGLFATLAPP